MTTPKEKCLYYGLPGIAILAVATFISMRVSADFQHDTLIKSATFIGSNAIGWLLYYILQVQLQELSPFLPSFHPKNNISNNVCEEAEAKEVQYADAPTEQSELEGEQNGQSFLSAPVQSLFTSEQYRQRNNEMERQRVERQQNLLLAIAEYIHYTMSPYLREEDLPRLTDEIMAWATNPAHEPPEIPLKNNLLTTFDLRHFIWNIGERLGKSYTGEIRADFMMALFPNTFSDVKTKRSVMNFLAKSANGDSIAIDKPDKGDFAFHYPTATKSTQTITEQPQKHLSQMISE